MSNLIKILSLSLFVVFALNGCAVDPAQDDPQSTESAPPDDTTTEPTELKAWGDGIQALQPAGTATCSPLQAACSTGATCCSGSCNYGCNHPKQCCQLVGQACQTTADCCAPLGRNSAVCSAGKCVLVNHACF